MDKETIMKQLESLGTERTRKTYKKHGAKEPFFGVTISAMKPLAKEVMHNQELADQLYATGNYDAMYFAGMIADPKAMTKDDFERWMKTAYMHMISDYIVAVTLAETDFAKEVADGWINSDKELYMSAGWSCYDWLLGSRPDSEFDSKKIMALLKRVETTIHSQPNRAKYAMNNFVISVGISYLPLHNEAVITANIIGEVEVNVGETSCKTPLATDYIQKAIDKNRLGFKRKYVRC